MYNISINIRCFITLWTVHVLMHVGNLESLSIKPFADTVVPTKAVWSWVYNMELHIQLLDEFF